MGAGDGSALGDSFPGAFDGTMAVGAIWTAGGSGALIASGADAVGTLAASGMAAVGASAVSGADGWGAASGAAAVFLPRAPRARFGASGVSALRGAAGSSSFSPARAPFPLPVLPERGRAPSCAVSRLRRAGAGAVSPCAASPSVGCALSAAFSGAALPALPRRAGLASAASGAALARARRAGAASPFAAASMSGAGRSSEVSGAGAGF